MVPKVAKTGTSFKGAMAYYLHDKRSEANRHFETAAGYTQKQTAERVAWTDTRNLAANDPELGGRIMAATAMDQQRLKEQSGIQNTGRKSAKSVYSYSLAWHPDEKAGLTKSEMLRAANESLRVIGAEKHQAVIVAHQDEAHPHIHVIVNRVSAEDGRMLSTSNDRKKLQDWALAYEREREKIWCQNRQNKRDPLHPTFNRSTPSCPYHIHKVASKTAQASNDNPQHTIQQQQKEKDAKLAKTTAEMHTRHKQQWQDLSTRYKTQKNDIYTHAQAAQTRLKTAIHERYRPQWKALYENQREEKTGFYRQENKTADRIHIRFPEVLKTPVSQQSAADKGWFTIGFNYQVGKHTRAQAFNQAQAQVRKALADHQNLAFKTAKEHIKAARPPLLKKAYKDFTADRAALIQQQNQERSDNKGAWKDRRSERNKAFSGIQAKAEKAQKAKRQEDPKTTTAGTEQTRSSSTRSTTRSEWKSAAEARENAKESRANRPRSKDRSRSRSRSREPEP